MSLRVWLPLNGNNKNQGLLNINPTNLGTISYLNDGKIGKCLSAGVSTQTTNGISYDNNLVDILGTKFSCSIWVRPLGNHVHYNGTFISSGNWNSKCWSFGVNQDNTKVDIFSKNYNRYMDCTVPVNQWTHLVCTSDDGLVKLYKNGEYIGQSTQSATLDTDATNFCVGRETYASGYFSFNGNINDIRIYDHVLSLKEIKELSKGLVCHYKLDGNGSGDNILAGTSNTEVQYEYPESSYKDRWSKKTSIIPTASQYTLSFYAKSTVNGDKVRAHFYSPNTTTKAETNQGVTSTASDGNIDFTLSTRWERYWVVWTQTAADATKSVIFPRMFSQASGAATGTGTVSIKCVKLEEGNIATAWKPNTNDSSYHELGYDKNIIYDTSGYGYDGTPTGTLLTDSDTPRNSLSTNFGTNTDTVTITPCFSNGQQISEMSVSCWFKTNTLNSTNPNIFSLGENYFCRLRIPSSSSSSIWYYVKVGDTVGCSATFNSGKSLIDNTWHNVVYTFKDGIVIIYIDGVQIGTTDHSSKGVYMTCSNIGTTWHLAGYTATTEKFIGNLSDFRIYATALSADDIKELYNIGASIDKGNNLHTYELLESGSNELLAVPYTNAYSQKNDIPDNWHKKINDNGEIYFNDPTAGTSAGSRYISINPTNKTYYYDFCISVSAGNRFYIGFERYDKDKTPRSNNACVYVFGMTPSSDLVKARYKGTVNLSTDGVNPCAFISLRILNRWSGSTSETEGKATIHYLSLREVNNTTGFETTKLFKTGVFKADDFFEKNDKSNIEKDGIINMPNEFIEI